LSDRYLFYWNFKEANDSLEIAIDADWQGFVISAIATRFD